MVVVRVQASYFEVFAHAIMTVFGDVLGASRFDSTAREGWRRLLQFMTDELICGLTAEASDNYDQQQ